jgi:hypothetical protein
VPSRSTPDPRSEPADEPAQASPDSPRRRLLLGLLALETVAMAVVTVGYAIALAVDRRQTGAGYVLFEIALAALATVILALVGRGVARRRRWAHSLGATLQLVGLPFGFRLWQFGHWWAAIPELAVVVTTLLLMFAEAPMPGADSEEAAEPDPK